MSRAEVATGALFATSLVRDRLALDAALRAWADALRAASQGPDASRPGRAWSRPIDPGEPTFVARLHALVPQVTRVTGSPARRYRWTVRLGAHVAPPGTAITLDRPADAFWTALYVLDQGVDDPLDAADGGPLVLEDPRGPMPLMEAPGLRLRQADGLYRAEEVVPLETGALLLFPPWMRARIEPHGGGATRILIQAALVAMVET